MDDSTTKRCTRCGETKPLDCFSPAPRYKLGVSSRCKDCTAAYKRARRKDPRFAEAIQRERDQCNAHRRTDESRAIERERVNGQYQNNPAYREWRKLLSRRHGPKSEQSYRRRYHADPLFHAHERQKSNEANRRWRQTPKGKANNKAHWRRWRAAKLAAIGSHTAAEWDALCAHYNHCCLACGQCVPLTEDHIVPLVKGGTDDISNIQPLCRPCNSAKGTQTIDYRPAYVVGE